MYQCYVDFTRRTSISLATNLQFFTISTISSHWCWTWTAYEAVCSILTLDTCQIEKLYCIYCILKWILYLVIVPGKQGSSTHVICLVQFWPSPTRLDGHGPHFGPSGVSLHLTPVNIEIIFHFRLLIFQ